MKQAVSSEANGPTRRDFLMLSAGAAGAMYLSACGSNSGSAGRLPWLTAADHYVPGQLRAVARQTGVSAQPTLFSQNAPTLLKVKSTGGQFAMVTSDGYWVPKYFDAGLTELIDLQGIKVAKQMYSVARDFPIWQSGGKQMIFPLAWSTKLTYYNPKYVSPKPDSYQALLSPRYRNKIVVENDSGSVFAIAGLAVGADDPFNMNADEIARASDFLRELKPNILKLVSQAPEVPRALANESAWIAFGNLGFDYTVKEINGPEIESIVPKEGVYGWADGEQVVKASGTMDSFELWVEEWFDAEWIAKNFLMHGRPLFNEKAYKLLVDQGRQEQADRLFYNRPEVAFEQKLQGPADNQEAYTDAFNEIFG